VAFGTIYKAIGWQSESPNNLCEGSFFRSSKRLILLKRGHQKIIKAISIHTDNTTFIL
jgi:hypothetical protein